MSRLTAEITPDQIDDWFRIGKKAVKVQSIARSSTGGRFIDPDTLKPAVAKVEQVPHYKRQPKFHGGHDYAVEYQEKEEEALISRSAFFSNDIQSEVSSHLDALELDSSVGASALPTDLAPANATEIYNQYDFSHKHDNKLPIINYKEQIISTVESNQVTVIQGATGSGKTTQVAQYILDHYASMHKYCNIIVTQPRRIAAISIARRVCSERGWQIGTVCGYQVALDRVANDDTRILYCTTGILLNKLINEKNMHAYTHVILDEVHERDQDTDFSLLVVRKLLRTNSRHTRVVLMSATFDSDMFAQYFALPVQDQLEPAPIVSVEGKPFKVTEYYAEDLQQLGEIPPLDECSPSITDESRHLSIQLIKQFDKIEEKEQGLGPDGFAPIRGTVLVFLPGEGEITDLNIELKNLSVQHQLRVMPLHSKVTMEEQAQVFNMAEMGWRKVILSTNIAESSITVPDIKYVIDFCLTKNLVCDFETNYTSLQLHWASKANCTQRKGRAGRVSNGRVYRLVTRTFFENTIPEYGLPEMQRCPLDKLILQVKVLDLGEPKAILALALSPPNLDDIERNVLLLKEAGALSTLAAHARNVHDGELTFVGRVLAALPIDIKIGKLILLGHVFGLLEECLIIGAAMSLKSVFARPFQRRLEAYRHKLGWADGSLSDCLAILNAYKSWLNKRETGAFKRSGAGGELGYGKTYYLQIRRLKEISELVKDVEKRLEKFNIHRPKNPPHYKKNFSPDQERLLLKVVISGAFYPNYFIRGEIDEMESLKSLSGRNPLNTVMVKGLPSNQGTLYKEQLEDQFRKCEVNPKAYFEETRAYIEFPWKPNEKSKVHNGVYMACKMKQLRMPVVVDLYSTDDARIKLQSLQEAQDKMLQPGQLRTNRLTGVSQVVHEPGTSRMGVHVPPPDPARDIVSICITEVIECGHFWAQYGEEENYKQLYQVQEFLNKDRECLPKVGTFMRIILSDPAESGPEGGAWIDGYDYQNKDKTHCHYEKYKNPLNQAVRVGLFCVAPFMDETLDYYRAKIHAVERKHDPRLGAHRQFVEVFFVDYGNSCEMPVEELRELPSQLLEVPFQAFECQLVKIRPSPIKCPDGRWTMEATSAFRQMALHQQSKVIARPYSIVHGVLRVELILVTQRGQFYVNQTLVEMGYADETEESGQSKQNHEKRELEYQARNRSMRAKEEETSSSQIDWLPISLGDAVAGLGDQRKKGQRKNLTGPSSPYEMNFYSITNVGRLRNAKIDPDSVNSVAIDDEPHDPHMRLLCAGFVGLNPGGSSMIARDTTILPLIPGLAAIITLLFTPVAEFRVDPKKTRYIGAICGLGVDPHTKRAALPDNDIELPFDVKIDLEDILKINGVRMAVNIAIGSQASVTSWGPDAVYKIQESARRKLMDLIQKRRESCEIQNPQRMYQWNLVDPEDILDPGIEQQDCPMLLNLHDGILLQEDETEMEGDSRTEYFRKHLETLRQIIKSNTRRAPTLCELCDVTCPTPQLLALHMETRKHKELENNIMKT